MSDLEAASKVAFDALRRERDAREQSQHCSCWQNGNACCACGDNSDGEGDEAHCPHDGEPCNRPPPPEVTLAVARHTADYWRRSLLDLAAKIDLKGQLAIGAAGLHVGIHALCMVLAAIDGEIDPTQLGIGPDGLEGRQAAVGRQEGNG